MPRLTKDQISSLKSEYNSGVKPSELMAKYGVTKHAVYHHVGSKGKKSHISFEDNTKDESVNDTFNGGDNEIMAEDPLIDFEQLSTPPKSRKDTDIDIFDFTNDEEEDLFNPQNIVKGAFGNEGNEGKKEKFSMAGFFKGVKNIGKEEKLTPEEQRQKNEDERLKLVYQVRLYLYTFKENKHLFLALNLDLDDKKINKFIQDLYRKKNADLKKMLEFIKFHIRHDNHNITGNFVANIFFTIIKVIETILYKFGIDLTGLSDDLRNDPELMSNLKEIEIEMTSQKLNLGAKGDLLLKICTKSLTKYTENKLIKSMKKNDGGDTTKQVYNKLSEKPKNEELEEKFNDL